MKIHDMFKALGEGKSLERYFTEDLFGDDDIIDTLQLSTVEGPIIKLQSGVLQAVKSSDWMDPAWRIKE